MSDLIFNSVNTPIPGLRNDLDIMPIQHEGAEYLYFYDMLGYTPDNFVLKRETSYFLSMFDGEKSVTDIIHQIPQNGDSIRKHDLLDFIQFLDSNLLLRSDHFKAFSNERELKFEESDVRPPSCAGGSYPADPVELRAMLEEHFSKLDSAEPVDNIKALYAPHIDPRVGLKSYIKAFAPLKNVQPKRVVLIATSHYAGLYGSMYQNKPFIGSHKHFRTPLGRVTNDREGMELISTNATELGISLHDRAHRIEHSIEMHLIFLQYLWKHDFTLLPILAGSFDELLYLDNGHTAKKIDNMTDFLRNTYGSDDETLFLISGDLAHFGKKFGDPQPASNYFEEVQKFDQQFLDKATKAAPDQIIHLMRNSMDRYRICGFPPLLTFLKSIPNVKGKVLSYDLWDETERDSAVTFGSVLYTTIQ